MEFATWAYMSTAAGAVVATATITQFIKGISFIDKIPTRIVSWVIALIILVAANIVTGTTAVSEYALCLFNAILVSLAANGAYDNLNSERNTHLMS
jgi:hypothetical protein